MRFCIIIICYYCKSDKLHGGSLLFQATVILICTQNTILYICVQWYRNPDYNLFTPYVKYRKRFPAQPFYILHPKFIWQLWDVIQANTLDNIQPNPPSSGFIGKTFTFYIHSIQQKKVNVVTHRSVLQTRSKHFFMQYICILYYQAVFKPQLDTFMLDIGTRSTRSVFSSPGQELVCHPPQFISVVFRAFWCF